MRTLQGHTGLVNAVAVTPDGRQAISASDDRTLKVWDLASGPKLRSLGPHGRGQRRGGDARRPRAVSASEDRTLKVWDISAAAAPKLRTLEGHTDWVCGVAVTPDGRRPSPRPGTGPSRSGTSASGPNAHPGGPCGLRSRRGGDARRRQAISAS